MVTFLIGCVLGLVVGIGGTVIVNFVRAHVKVS